MLTGENPKMENHSSNTSKLRSRSGSGVRLEYYQRLVNKTILKYQVIKNNTLLMDKEIIHSFIKHRIQLQDYFPHLQQMNMLGFETMYTAYWQFGPYQWLIRNILIWMKTEQKPTN